MSAKGELSRRVAAGEILLLRKEGDGVRLR
jgi:hypothetical protein